MPLIPVGTAQVNLIFTGTSLPNGAECTFGVDLGVGGNPTVIAGLVDDAVGVSGFMSNLSNEVELSSILVKFGPVSTGASAQISTSHSGSAGVGGPPNVTFLVRKTTDDGGRAGRGRMYLPQPAESQVAPSGAVEGAAHSALQSDLDTFFGELVASDIPMLVLHGSGSPISVPSEVTALVLDGHVATQRRRLRP